MTEMKIATVIVRVLLGLPFHVFGLNSIHPFMPMQTMPGDAGTLGTIMMTHHWFAFIGLLEVVAGILLLVGKYVPIALVLLGPILVVILLFHVTLAPASIGAGALFTLFEIFLIYRYWPSSRGIFTA